MEKGGLSGVSFYRVGKQRATGSCSGGAVPSFKGMCGNVLAELLGKERESITEVWLDQDGEGASGNGSQVVRRHLACMPHV